MAATKIAFKQKERGSHHFYITSVAADLVPCSVQSLRAYIKERKIAPARTCGEGNASIALFTDEDIKLVRKLMRR